MTTVIPLIYDLDPDGIAALMGELGQPDYRTGQLLQALYVDLVASADEITTFSKALRARLAERAAFSHLDPAVTLDSTDGHTTKTLFKLPDGEAIETVLMRYRDRSTLCISSQAGCAMGCVFCATGQMGFRRNLTRGQIVEQVVFYARRMLADGHRPTNIVLMGMGEPFHNYDATLEAIDILNHPDAMNLGARRFTISTVGLVPAIRRFTAENRQINLAVSLHAATDEARAAMLPINDRYPLGDLIPACRDYVVATGRRITFEWALIRDVNDSVEEAARLARLLEGLICHVNVIPLNPTGGYAGEATTAERAEAFRTTLESSGITCTIRVRRGIDIAAGCGQLAVREAD